jgi:hypothetical protein
MGEGVAAGKRLPAMELEPPVPGPEGSSMRRRHALAAAAALIAAAPQAASAATATLTVHTEPGHVVAAGTTQGVPVFKTYYRWPTELDGSVVSDVGQPAASVAVALVRIAPNGTSSQLQRSTTGSDGSVRFTGIDPTYNALYVLRVAASPDQGTSAVDSNQVLIGVAPRIIDESPSVTFGHTYPIRGRIQLPHPASVGIFLLQKREGKHFRTLARKPPTNTGKFAFEVEVTGHDVWNRFKVTFLPRGAGQHLYLSSEISLRVRRK